jgi:M6 family metalloprotease-like protein
LIAADASKSEKPAGPDLSEFKTVDSAIKAKLVLPIATPTATQPGYLGVHAEKNASGALVIVQVEPDSPAAKGGLQAGDQLREFGGKSVKDTDTLRDLLHATSPGQKQQVAVVRKDKPLTLEVTLAPISSPLTLDPASSGRAVLGVQVDPDKEGLKLTSVTADGAASKAGLKVGDVILKADGKGLPDVEALRELLGTKTPGDRVTLIVKRAGKEQEFKPILERDPERGGRAGREGREGWDTRRTGAWTRDAYNLAVIPIEFPDQKPNPNVTPKDWEMVLFSKGVYTEKSPTGQKVYGSMNDYYQEISCGKFRVTGKVFDSIAVKEKRETYGSSTSNKTALLTEAVDKLLAREKNALKDFDGIFFLYAGGRVQTNRGGIYWPHRASFRHSGRSWAYFICPEGGNQMSSISVISHEFGHMLGLPDLYARPERPGEEGVGIWCTMSTGHGRDGKPLHFSAWCKERLGWLKPAVIDPRTRQKLILSPVESSDTECYKVLLRPDGGEYLLLENRIKKGYDRDLPAEGLLIWRVVNNRPILEESHGIAGPQGPMRFLGSIPYPSRSNSAFTPYTTPSSKPLTGGGLPVHITNIRKLPDGRITFFIGYEYY